MDGVINMKEMIMFNESSTLSDYIDDQLYSLESYDSEFEDICDVYQELYDAYINEVDFYQEGEIWDTATGVGKNENIIMKILKFLPRLVIALGHAISKSSNDEKTEEAAENIAVAVGAPVPTGKKTAKGKSPAKKKTATRSKRSTSTDMITIDRDYFDRVEKATKMFIKYSRNIPKLFMKWIKDALKTGNVPYGKAFLDMLPIDLDFKKTQPLITASGEKASINKIGPRLLSLKKDLDEASEAYRNYEATFKKDWQSMVNDYAKDIQNSYTTNAQQFAQKVMIPNFANMSNHVVNLSKAVSAMIKEVGYSDTVLNVVTESFYDDFDENESVVVEYMI